MASSVSSRKMSTGWSLRRAGRIPTLSADVVERVVTTAVEEPPGEETPADDAQHWREGTRLARCHRKLGAYRLRRIASRLSSLPTSPVRRRAEGYRRPSRWIGQPMRSPGLPRRRKQNARLPSQRHHHSCSPPSTLLQLQAGHPKSVIRVRDIADHNCRQDRSREFDPLPPGISLGATQHSPTGLLAPAAQG